ncbi:MAG: aspartate/glutamate racemase family protein [Deltaproteobacteria bacterium]|nr:MAG: aspartate/glutamate racemase family protein [Deltaproteobacteria bacterium]
MIYHTQKGQVSSGEAIGILLLDSPVPFIPGDVANATTYSFPVRFQKVENFSVNRAIGQDTTVYDNLLHAARSLVQQGVRAVTGDCGFMGIHQPRLARELHVPVFLSSLIQIPFISCILGGEAKLGVITADATQVTDDLLNAVGVSDSSNLVIGGLQDQRNFHEFAIEESGFLDADAVEAEVVGVAKRLVAGGPNIRAILLECSLLPPYAAAVQEAVNLPVFDYITMINFVFSAVVKQRYRGFM